MSQESKDTLGDRIKGLERQFEGEPLDPHKPFVVRLDGHGFSKFTRGFQKPLDMGFARAMVATTKDLVKEFSARTGFTESDEITLVFPAISNPESTLIYGGRIQKLASLTAGYASTRFNHHLSQQQCICGDKLGIAYFDARVFSVANEKEAYEAIYWRYRYDTFRNGVMSLAQTHFSHKQLHKKPLREVMNMLKEKQVMLNEQTPHLLYGTFVKKELYEGEGLNPKTGEKEKAMRTRLHSACISNWDLIPEQERIAMVMAKYWPNSEIVLSI